MYRHIILAGSIAMTFTSPVSNAEPIDRLEEERPLVAAHLKADAREHPNAYQQAREDALNNPGKTRRVIESAREHPVATRHVYREARANPEEAATVYRDAKNNRDRVIRAHNRAIEHPNRARQLSQSDRKKQTYKRFKRKAGSQ
jgi:hypothetical protein